MFIEVMLTIARTWKQPRCPLTDEWIKKMWYIFTMEYYSTINNNNVIFRPKMASQVMLLVKEPTCMQEI